MVGSLHTKLNLPTHPSCTYIPLSGFFTFRYIYIFTYTTPRYTEGSGIGPVTSINK